MATKPPFTSFREFWPYYVREHSVRANRALHFVGTSGALALAAAALTVGPGWLGALAPLSGYGGAWIGHFFIQKNRPATFKHPFYSLAGDFVMLACIATGRMQGELERALSEG